MKADATPVRIRPRAATDLEGCARLLWSVHVSDGYPMFWPPDPVRWLSPTGMLAAWVAEVEGRPLGHIAVRAAEQESDPTVWSTALAGAMGDITIRRSSPLADNGRDET